MKKYFYILLSAALAASLIACNGNPAAPASSTAPQSSSQPASSTVSSSVSSSIAAQPKTLEFSELGFSFTTPENWDENNYTSKVVKDAVMDQQIKYRYVDFLFKDDTNKPLLRLLAMSKKDWSKASSQNKNLQMLIEQEDTVYAYTLEDTLTANSSASEDEKIALYNSMLPTQDDVKKGFSLLKAEAKTLEGVLQDGAMQTIVIKTDDNKTLTFDKQNAEVIAPNGLLIGQRLRLTYTGTITKDDPSTVKLTKIEVIG